MIYKNSLEEQSKFILEEARIVVPGIQALLGFQMIAIFNEGFYDHVPEGLRWIHLLAIFFIIVAMVFVLAPPALHRLAEPDQVSSRFAAISTGFLTWAMAALRVGVALDFYLVCQAVTENHIVSAILAFLIFLISYVAWSAYPRLFAHWMKPPQH